MIVHRRRKDRYFELVVYMLKSTLKLTLHLIFAYWATQSVLKYVDEPAITNIYYRYTSSYEFNSTSGYKGIDFPCITFCDVNPEYENIFGIRAPYNLRLLLEKICIQLQYTNAFFNHMCHPPIISCKC